MGNPMLIVATGGTGLLALGGGVLFVIFWIKAARATPKDGGPPTVEENTWTNRLVAVGILTLMLIVVFFLLLYQLTAV